MLSAARLQAGNSEAHFRMSKKPSKKPSEKPKEKMKNKVSVILAMLSAAATLTASADERAGVDGAVFTMNNSSNENRVLVFHRGENGALTFASEVSTLGLGTGAGLGSQGGLVLSEGHQWLFAVNAGS